MAAIPTGASIPRIIHQIWLGSNPEPRIWTDTVRAFAKDHGWDYKLWDEAAVRTLDLDAFPGLAATYADFKDQLAGRADILRYLILYKYGGVYMDADCVILRPTEFAKFFEANTGSMFLAWEKVPPRTVKKYALREKTILANSIIGASAAHPFLEETLKGIGSSAKRSATGEAWMTSGPLYLFRVYSRLRRSSGGKAATEGLRIVPMRIFYPMHWKGIKDPEYHRRHRIPGRSLFFQYGYSTNKFAEIFAEQRGKTRRQRRRSRKAD